MVQTPSGGRKTGFSHWLRTGTLPMGSRPGSPPNPPNPITEFVGDVGKGLYDVGKGTVTGSMLH